MKKKKKPDMVKLMHRIYKKKMCKTTINKKKKNTATMLYIHWVVGSSIIN